MQKIYPIILAGGSGTRLWPLSRASYPKQFFKFAGDKTLLQQTIERNISQYNKTTLLTGGDLRFIVKNQAEEVVENIDILLEPEVKDTLPACLLAALYISSFDPDAILLIAPSDHLIKDEESYRKLIERASSIASEGRLVTFGVTPTKPHTGYGYIEKGKKIKDGIFAVEKFHEKPSEAKAEEYLKTQKHLWNSGIFLFKAKVIIDEIRKVNPEFLDLAERVLSTLHQENEYLVFSDEMFSKLPKISIDYGLLERVNNIAVVEADINWSDLGSWSAIEEVLDRDEDNNVISGDNIRLSNCKNVFVKSTSDKLIACYGVKDVSLVQTDDAILLIDSKQTEKVKDIVGELKADNMQEVIYHLKTYRPWGYYRIINEAKTHKTKELTIHPGKGISLQYHYKRAEHWVVVEGIAKVIKGDKKMILRPNESIYIPKTVRHQLINSGDQDLKIIEVQTGDYLGEDDIVRIDCK